MVQARASLGRVLGETVVFLSLSESAALLRRPESRRAAAGHCEIGSRNLLEDYRHGLVERASLEICRQEEACALRALRGDGQSQRLCAVSIRFPTFNHIMYLPGQVVFAGRGHRFDTHRSVATSALRAI